mmetsp:Transcript_37572/g.93036  ORF Transcript_37572/g.93036 Transcript_37572/m.93036 type:complete len:92 (+) Transcript_37572:1603-1878(+)
MHGCSLHGLALAHATSQRTRVHGSEQSSGQLWCTQREMQGSTHGAHGTKHCLSHLLCSQRVSQGRVHGGHGSLHGCFTRQSWPQSRRREHE